MKNKFLLFLFLLSSSLVFGTIRNVSTFSGTTWGTSDTALVNNNFTLDTSVSIGAWWFPAGETYTLSKTGTQTVTLNNNGLFFKDSSSGAKAYPDSFAILGSGTAMISSGAGTITGGATIWYFAGNDTVGMLKTSTYRRKRIAAGASLTELTGSNFATSSTTGPVLVIGNNGVLNSISGNMSMQTAGDLYSLGTGTTITFVSPQILTSGTGGKIVTLPSITATNTQIVMRANAVGDTIRLTGNHSWSGNILTSSSSATVRSVFDFNDYNFSCSLLRYGASVAHTTGWIYTYFGNGTHTIGTFGDTRDSAATPSTAKCYFEGATFNITGNVFLMKNTLYEPGTSQLNLTGSAAQSVTSYGQPFYDFTVNNSGTGNISFADSLYCEGDLSLLDGKVLLGRASVYDYLNTTNDSVIQSDTCIIRGSYTRNNDKTRRTGGAMSFRGDDNATITLLDDGSLGLMTVRKSSPSATITAGSNIKAARIIDSIGAIKMLSYSLQCTTLTNYSSGLQCAAVTMDTLRSFASATLGGGTIVQWNWLADGIAHTMAQGTTLTTTSMSGFGGTSGSPDSLIGSGTGATLTAPKCTVSYAYVTKMTATNTMYLDSHSTTGGSNTGVKSLSYTGATLSASTGAPTTSITVTAGNGLVGGTAKIGAVEVDNWSVTDNQTATFDVPDMAAGTYEVMICNSDEDTLVIVGGFTVESATTGRKRWQYRKFSFGTGFSF